MTLPEIQQDADAGNDVAVVGENINVCWSPDGQTIAVGNKEDLVTFIDVKMQKARAEEQFKFEVNEISWNNDGDLFFLTSGHGSIHLLRYLSLYAVDSTLSATSETITRDVIISSFKEIYYHLHLKRFLKISVIMLLHMLQFDHSTV